MRYIELTEGFSVKKSDVSSVTRMENGGSSVVLSNGREIDTGFHYKFLLQLLETDEVEINQHQQHFAG